ncbi:MAG: Gfo/Idh/MocA family oxidoreductase [Candidatus Omnitrophota bacterium]|jgi:predicted dehydrogenase
MKELRAGIIGCGTIFPMHAESLMNLRGVKLVAVCDVRAARAKAKAKKYHCRYYTDYKLMLRDENLDVVHICTPHYLHKPMIIEAAKRGVNVLTEKPMGLNPKEASDEIKAAKRAGIVFSSIFQNRFNPGSQLVKKRIDDGSLGKLKAARLVLSYHKPDSYYKKSDWKGRLDKEGGAVVIDQAIHYIDMLRWLVPSPVKYVDAVCRNRMHTFIKVEDSADGIIMFKNGFYACFHLINYYSYDDDPEIEIDCEKARVNIVKDSAKIGYFRGKKEEAKPKASEYIDYGDGVRDYWGYCHFSQIRDYYNSLRAGKKPAVTADDAKKTQDLVWAIYESSRRNRRIYL